MARQERQLKFSWVVEEDKEAIQKAFEVIMRGEKNESGAICPGKLRQAGGREND